MREIKREKSQIVDYKMLCEYCRETGNDDFGQEARETAYELFRLKNHIWLLLHYAWDIDFSNADSPDFFKESGLMVHEEGISYLLEEMETFIL